MASVLTTPAPVYSGPVLSAPCPTAEALAFCLAKNDRLGLDRQWLAAVRQFPNDAKRAKFAFLTDVRVAVRAELCADLRGPLGAVATVALLNAVRWAQVVDELAARWDVAYLADLVQTLAECEAEAAHDDEEFAVVGQDVDGMDDEPFPAVSGWGFAGFRPAADTASPFDAFCRPRVA